MTKFVIKNEVDKNETETKGGKNIVNKSLYCNESYIDLGKMLLVKDKSITFSAWINPQNINDETYIFSQISARSGVKRFGVGIYNNRLSVYNGDVGYTYGKSQLNINCWYNVVYVFQNNILTCYLNGDKEITLSINHDFYTSNTFLLSYYQGNDYYFKGYIDEFKVYNYALNENEITKKMHKREKDYSNLLMYFNFDKIVDNDNILDLVTKQKYKIHNFNRILKEIVPPLQFYKYLIRQNNKYYSLKSSPYELGQPKDNIELEKWYKENGADDLNTLIEQQNSKLINLKLDKNELYKTITPIDFNEITDKIEYINEDNKKEIKYNTEEYQLLDLVKKNIGNKFQIVKWEEK